MNFFQAQKKAKKLSSRLIFFYFLILVVLTALISAIASPFLFHNNYFEFLYQSNYFDFQYNQEKFILSFMVFFPIVLLITLITSFIRYRDLKSEGGKLVALSLGGKQIGLNTTNTNEKKILNVVEEMAIASGVSVPAVYLLQDDSINAFVAGFSQDDAVIGITKGAIEYLSRDELQGVIAHEFSHIFHGDMRLNMKLTSLIVGLYILSIMGEGIFRVSNYFTNFRSSSDNKLSFIGLAIAVLGLIFFFIGWLGSFFGHIFQAAISRQREFLADASAVQYTRDPHTIGNALKKIGGLQYSSNIKSENTKEFAHSFFANAQSSFVSKLYSTHPPLEERIKRVDKTWDGKFILAKKQKVSNQEEQSVKKEQEKKQTQEKKEKLLSSVIASIGLIPIYNEKEIQKAKDIIDEISKKVKDEISTPLGAVLITYAVLASKDSSIRNKQWDILKEHYPLSVHNEVVYFYNLVSKMEKDQKIVAIELAMPSLKMLSKMQYQKYKKVIDLFILADNKIEAFEAMVKLFITNILDRTLDSKKEPKEVNKNFKSVKDELSYILSVVANIDNKSYSKKQFEKINKEMFDSLLEYKKTNNEYLTGIDNSIDSLLSLPLDLREKILEAILLIIKDDDIVTQDEFSLLKVFSITLGLPLQVK